MKIHRLTILNSNTARWLCHCECGTIKFIERKRVKSGHTKSCGCLQKEKAAKTKTTHGFSGTSVHQAWKAINQRCNNKKTACYGDYGGRGIRVEWKNFANFLNDMGLKPSKNHSIDRIDNNGNYSRGNCRWATRIEQNNNRRDNRRFDYKGEKFTLTELSKMSGVKYLTIWKRLNRGWPTEKAVTP